MSAEAGTISCSLPPGLCLRSTINTLQLRFFSLTRTQNFSIIRYAFFNLFCQRAFFRTPGRDNSVNSEKATMNASHEDDIAHLCDALENRLQQLLPPGEPKGLVYAAMRDATLIAGKRMRPLLLLLAARDMGCDIQRPGIVDLACAVEMIHAASLVLDDMPSMDNARLRRGKPTIHCQYGENVAMLAAVSLLSHAFGVIACAPELNPEVKSQASAALSVAIGHLGLAQGQFLDLYAVQHGQDVDAIVLTNELKTSSLFDATLQIAAIAAGAQPPTREHLRGLAREMGQAFQLMDDLADGLNHTGKDAHKDRDKKRATLVAALGAEAVYHRLCQHLRCADSHIVSACTSGRATRRFMHAWFNKYAVLINPQGLSAVLEVQ